MSANGPQIIVIVSPKLGAASLLAIDALELCGSCLFDFLLSGLLGVGHDLLNRQASRLIIFVFHLHLIHSSRNRLIAFNSSGVMLHA